MTIAFLNLPWFVLEDGKLRRGIRAGSRWPFTLPAPALPDSKNAPIGHYLPAPYFLMSAAGWVKRDFPEANVIVRDSVARYEGASEFAAWWEGAKPEYVILETGSPCWEHDLTYIREMRANHPGVKIAVAGPNARELSVTTAPGIVDAFLLGEYDRTASRFVKGERGAIGFDLLSRDDLKTAPFPIFDEDVAHHYADSNPKAFDGSPHPWPELTVWGSRGCFARCVFCSWPATMTNDDPTGTEKRVVRYYDQKWLEAFIEERKRAAARSGRPLQAVRFDDDLGNVGDRHTLAICEVMKKVRLPWSMMCRADTVKRETWQAMRDAGCFGVKIGFESASDRIVNEVVGKKLDLKEAEETCRFLRSIGMSVHTTWMIGSASETPAERKLTLDTIRRFYVENVHNSHQLSGQATISGTPLANTTISDPNFIRDADGQHKLERLLAT